MKRILAILLLTILFEGCAESELNESQVDPSYVLDATFTAGIQYGGSPFGGVQLPQQPDRFIPQALDQNAGMEMRDLQLAGNEGDDMHLNPSDQLISEDQALVDMSIPMPMPDMQVVDPVAACPRMRVVNTGVDGLRLRPAPNRNQNQIAIIPDGTELAVLEIVDNGEDIMGNRTWYQVSYQNITGYVSAYYCQCLLPPDPNMPQAAEDFRLPFSCGSRYRVTQGNHGDVSHMGRTAYAFDFGMSLNTPMLAMRAGVVRHTRAATGPGDNCYNGGGPECRDFANYVVLEHNDGTGTAYVHLNRVDVQVGQRVNQGEQVGLSGSTGYSTGPHAHIERQQLCANRFCQSIELRFADVDVHGGIPQDGEWVVSGNCH